MILPSAVTEMMNLFLAQGVLPLSVVDNSDFSPNDLTGVSTLPILA
jgi:hypothetical protein